VQYCATCIAEMLHNTKHRDSSVNIPLSPDQHHCSDEAKWRIGRLVQSVQSTALVCMDLLVTCDSLFYTKSQLLSVF